MSGVSVMGRMIKVNGSALRCDFDGPGHQRLIPGGHVAYQITQGEAQGLYHGKHCYQAALAKYRSLKKQHGFDSNS